MSQTSPHASSPHPPATLPPGLAAGASPVIRATFSTHGFIDGPQHCQQVADYLARFAASDFDLEPLTTRLTTHLHALLGLVIRGDPGPGLLVLAIDRRPDRLELALGCHTLHDPDLPARITSHDLGRAPPGPGDPLVLRMSVPLERPSPSDL